jgi:P-type conjugative transfer protein TrbL
MDPTLLNSALTPIASAVGHWQTAIFALGYPLFWMLAFIELGIVAAMMIVNRDLPGMMDDLVCSVIGIAVAYILFENAADWMRNGVIATIGNWGGMVGDVDPNSMNPDGILAAGWGLASTLLKAMAHGHWLTMPVSDLVILLAAAGITVVFGWTAIMLLELLIESYVAAIGGSIFLPIGAFRFSSHVMAYYFGWVLSVAVRFFFTFALLGVAEQLIQTWSLDLNANVGLITGNLTIPFQIVIESILFLMMLIHVPTFAGRMLVGAVMPSVGTSGLAASMTAAGSAASDAGQAVASAAYKATLGDLVDKLLLET